MANKKISELPYINVTKISGNTLVPLVTYFSAATGDTVHTYANDLKSFITSGISGNYLPLSGGTVSGGTRFLSGLTANTVSATTYFNLPTDVRVTGGTYSAGTITFTNNTGGTFNVTGLTTGSTSIVSGNFLPLSGGTVSGGTRFLSGLTANTISATTYFNLPSATFSGGTVTGPTIFTNGLTANTISATTYQNLPTDIRVTGATYSNNTFTYTNNTGGTFSTLFNTVTGLTVNGGLTITGNTSSQGLTATTISATTYQNLPTDIRVTGGTYSAGTISFTNNTGGTFSVTGLTTGSTSNVSGDYLPLSGGTVTGGTIFTSGVTANTISNTTYIDFNTGTTNPSAVGGRVFFDNTSKSLTYYDVDNNNVPIAMGQQLYVRGNNATGSQINKGSVVMVTGTTNTLPSIALATNNHAPGSPRPIGLAAENIPSGNDGLVIVNGILSGITLNTFANGDTLYLSNSTPGGYVSSTSSLPFSARTNEIGYVLQTGTTTGKIYVNINSEDSNLTLTDIERNILEGNVISTGIYEYTGMSVASSTTINVAPASGWIVNNTYNFATLPDVTNIYYSGGTGITITNIATADATYILLTSASTITQQTTFPTPQQRRENIFLGKVVHPSRTSILNVNNTVDFDVSPMSALRDLWTPIRLINQGVIPSANTGLTINTTAGTLWGNGIGWVSNQLNPDSVSISAKTPASFFYRTQTGGTSGSVSVIDPTKYDVGGVITSMGGAGVDDSSNQRIYLYPTGVINILYGQHKYNNLAAAVAAIQSETFVVYPNAETTGILIGVLSVRNDIVADGESLTNTDYAKFTLVSKFGESFGGTGGLSTTTLQQAYDNSTTPEITTNSTLGPLSVKNGAGTLDNVTNVFEGVNAAGTTTSYVRADGLISGNSLNAPNLIISGGTQSIFSGNSSSDLVRITQTGVGNAFVVDDSTNPDSTPFVINSGGSVSIGTTSVFSVGGAETKLNISNGSSGVATTGLTVSTPIIVESSLTSSIGMFSPDNQLSQIYFGTPSDALGAVLRWDYTKKDFSLGSSATGGKLIFLTGTYDEVARIDQNGNMGIGLTGATQKFEVSGNSRIIGTLSANTVSATTYLNLPSFSGGSGNCITDLYVTNVYGCSPITLQSSLRNNQTTSTGDLSHSEGFGTETAINNAYSAQSVSSGLITLSSTYGDVTGEFSAGDSLLFYDIPFDNTYGSIITTISASTFNGVETEIQLQDITITTTTAYVGDITFGINNWTGDQTIPGHYSHAEGYATFSMGQFSHAEGSGTYAIGYVSHSEGTGTYAIGETSHAEGGTTQSRGTYSHSEGYLTQSIGYASHSEGYNTKSIGDTSHSEGRGTSSIGGHSHSEGFSTKSGYKGYQTSTPITSGVFEIDTSYGDLTSIFTTGSFIIFQDNYAEINTGVYTSYLYEVASSTYNGTPATEITLVDTSINTSTPSSPVGIYNSFGPLLSDQSMGAYSHSEGTSTQAIGEFSHSEGKETVSLGWGQTVVGKFNEIISTPAAFIVGDGVDNNNRHNLLVASNSGVTISGTLSATTYLNLPRDIRVTGGTYFGSTITFTNNTGGTFTVTGITTSSSSFTGGTVTGATNFTGGLTANTISATTYQNLPTDIRVTGATNSNNTFTFTNNTGGTFSTIFNTVTGLTINGNLTVTGNTNVRAFTGTTGYISGSGQNILTVIGSGNSTTSPIFSIQGSSGELFSVNDSLTGSLFSVNDISGLPIMEVFSDNTTLMGSYQAPSLNTTTKVTLTAGTNTVYSIPTSAYTGAFIDYTLVSTGTTGARAGNIMTIWSGSTAQYTETSTNDIGNTGGVTFSVAVSGNNAVLSSSATTTGWTLKTIIRSI